MELRHIHYFLVLAEEKNVTRAAEKLCIAQPPLSRQIKDLEDELGTELFKRSNKGMELTEAGAKFREYALQIEHLADQSLQAMKEVNEGLQGSLYIATVEGQAPHLLAKWIKEFHELYPNVDYNLWNGNSDDVIARMKNGLCDLALIVGPYDAEGLDGLLVYKEPWVAIMSVNHPLADDKNTISLSKLAPYEIIIPSRQSRLQEIAGWFTKEGMKPKIVARLAHMLDAYELAAQNVGITIYPEAAGAYRDDAKVVAKKLLPEVTATYYFSKISGRELPPVAEKFWEYVSDSLKSE